MTATLKPGDRVSEYVLEAPVGRGGFGEVWKARHHIFNDTVVAVKIPLDDQYIRQLSSEGIIQRDVPGDHVVRTLGLDPQAQPPYFVMEFVDGENLRDRLAREGRLAPAQALALADQLLEALSDAHAAGVIHRDIKPANILIDRAGVLKLTDFGLGEIKEKAVGALVVSGSLVTGSGAELSGTYKYMAPEQQTLGMTVDQRADLYAFGLVLFEMLVGSLPQGADKPSDHVLGLDPRVDEIFARCYCRLEKRAHSAVELRERLSAVREGRSARASQRLLTYGQVMSLLGRTRKEVDALVQSGRLQRVQDGAIAKFEQGQVDGLRGGAPDGSLCARKGMGAALAGAAQADPPRDIFDRVQDSVLGEPATARTTTTGETAPTSAIPGAVLDIARAHPGGFWIRVLATIIDSIILIPVEVLDGGILTGFLYTWICHAVWGKTVGKAALGLRVVDVYGRPIGWGTSFFRTFMELVNLLTLGIGYFMAAIDDEKRGLHDHAAGTRVVYDR